MDSVSNIISGNYAMMRADNLQLVFPLQEMQSTALLKHKLIAFDDNSGLLRVAANKVDNQNSGQMYAALSEKAQLLKNCPRDRHEISVLTGLSVHWVWSEVRTLELQEVHKLTIPKVLKDPYSPFESYILVDGMPAFIIDSVTFLRFVFSKRNAK